VNTAARALQEAFFPNFLEVVPVEITGAVEKILFGAGGGPGVKFDCHKLQSAEHIGQLKQLVIRRLHFSERNILKEDHQGGIQNLGKFDLSVIVINDDFIESLKKRKMRRNIPADALREFRRHINEIGILFFIKAKRYVVHIDMPAIVEQGKKQLSPLVPGSFPVISFTANQRASVQSMRSETDIFDIGVKDGNVIGQRISLIVKDHCHKIVRRVRSIGPEITGLVYENA
jgi:hypothetical protein